MRLKTNMEKVKEVALQFLYLDMEPLPEEPWLVRHPFFSASVYKKTTNGNQYELYDLFEHPEYLEAAREPIKKAILECTSPSTLMYNINPAYKMHFLKDIRRYLSVDDMSEMMSDVWSNSANPNQFYCFSKSELAKIFAACNPAVLMSEEEYDVFKKLPSEITIYRGVSSYNQKSVRVFSWTLNEEKAAWFARRLGRSGQSGTVYRAKIKKENVFAYFDGRDEQEIVVNPYKLEDIEVIRNWTFI